MNTLYRMARNANKPVALLLLLYLAAATGYNVATPLYEAPDEKAHFRVALWLKETGTLPRIPADLAATSHEIGQPPLYYALVALAIRPIDTSDFARIAPHNPHWLDGGGRPVHYHDGRESFPYRRTVLAVHVARLVSTVLGALTVILTYRLARLVWPRAAVLATGLVALNPQFAFMSGTINNDNLIATTATLALYLAVLIYTTRRREPAWYLVLGGVIGLAALSKLAGLGLGVAAAWLLVAEWVRDRGEGVAPAAWRGTLLLAGFGLTAGWWFWRNWRLYGDPLAWQELLLANQAMIRPQPLSLGETLRDSLALKDSFWLLFAHGLRGPDVFYTGVNVLLLLALGGLGAWLAAGRRRAGPPDRGATLALMLVWPVTVFGLLLRWMRLAEFSNHGRLLFPAIAAVAVVLALGLSQYRRLHRRLPGAALAFLGAWSVAGPLLVVHPAFASPAPLAPGETPAMAIDRELGAGITLLGLDLPQDRWAAGEPVVFDLVWQAQHRIEASYVLAPRIIDSQNRVVSAADVIPAAGRYPTPMWAPGVPFAERHEMPPIAADAAPGLARLILIVYPFGQPEAPLTAAEGDPSTPAPILLAQGKIGRAPAGAAAVAPALVIFDPVAELTAATLTGRRESDLEVTLTWRGRQPDGQDYQVFVHLVDDGGQLVAQADGPPAGGAFPTSIWEPGELITDVRRLVLPAGMPAGDYHLRLGLYRLQDGARLPALRPDGTAWPDGAAVPLTIELPRPSGSP